MALSLVLLPSRVEAQFNYVTNNGTITITGYTGTEDAVTVPGSINGLAVTAIGDNAFGWSTLSSVSIPESTVEIGDGAFGACGNLVSVTLPGGVASIGNYAFWYCTNLTSISIPEGVTNIGDAAFSVCTRLQAITVSSANASYISVDGVLYNRDQSALLQCPGGATNLTIPNSATRIADNACAGCVDLKHVTIPDSVASLGDDAFNSCASLTSVVLSKRLSSVPDGAFAGCESLTNVVIPSGVTSFGNGAFASCRDLMWVFFCGDAPSGDWSVFQGDDVAFLYYLPGAAGWGTLPFGRAAILWNPVAQAGDSSFGVRTNRFGFKITGSPWIPIVVEACTNMAKPVWTPLQTLILTNGAFYFSDLEWSNYSSRYYRIRSP